jgi:hypothetical protein
VCENVLWDAERSRIWSKYAYGSNGNRSIASITSADKMIDNAVLRYPDKDSSEVGIDALELRLNTTHDVPHGNWSVPRPIALHSIDLCEYAST